ncbi:MAG: ComEA family DNA-binding protein [Candidatus Sulfotelmatobacter sp.]
MRSLDLVRDQPQVAEKHLSCMVAITPRLMITVFLLTVFMGCTDHRDNPDEIRRRTAEATETMRRDTKAVVDGVKEGMGHEDRAIDINRASRQDLLSLPGITERDADRIVAERPFTNADDLVKRRVISQGEYDRIRDRVIAGH